MHHDPKEPKKNSSEDVTNQELNPTNRDKSLTNTEEVSQPDSTSETESKTDSDDDSSMESAVNGNAMNADFGDGATSGPEAL